MCARHLPDCVKSPRVLGACRARVRPRCPPSRRLDSEIVGRGANAVNDRSRSGSGAEEAKATADPDRSVARSNAQGSSTSNRTCGVMTWYADFVKATLSLDRRATYADYL